MSTLVATAAMKGVGMNGFGSVNTFILRETPRPSPQEREVRIRIKSAGFNPVDYKIRQGWYEGDSHKILGFDCSGIVDAVGEGVQQFAVGDEVYSMALKSSNGTYAEYVSVPIELVAKKPRRLTFEEAAAVPLAAMTAYRATIAPRAFKEGDVVFVAGIGGGVGSFAVQFLRMMGVKKIYTIAKNQQSADFLHNKLGIERDHILIYEGLTFEQLKEQLLKMNNGRFFHATLDLVGGDRKRLCLALTGYSGHFSTILPEAHFTDPFWQENALPRARNLSVHQVNIGAELADSTRASWNVYQSHLEKISEMLENGKLQLPKIESVGSLSLKTVQKAHQLLEDGRVKGKLIMVVE